MNQPTILMLIIKIETLILNLVHTMRVWQIRVSDVWRTTINL
jgi:hypothetical protein